MSKAAQVPLDPSWIKDTFEPRQVPRSGDDTPARSLSQFVWRMSGRHQLALCLLAILVAVINLAPIELQRRIVDDAVERGATEQILWLGAIYLGVVVLHGALKYALRIYQSWSSESTIVYMRRHLLGLYSEDASEAQSGRAVSVLGPEADSLGGYVGESISRACADVAILLGVLAYMIAVEPRIALVSMLFLVPQILVTPWMQRKLDALVERHLDYMRHFGDEISAISDKLEEPCIEILPKIYRNRMRFALLKFAMKALLNLMNSLAPLSVLVAGGYLAVQGETTIGVVVAFLSGFNRISDPTRQLIAFYRQTAQARVRHDKIADWICERLEKRAG